MITITENYLQVQIFTSGKKQVEFRCFCTNSNMKACTKINKIKANSSKCFLCKNFFLSPNKHVDWAADCFFPNSILSRFWFNLKVPNDANLKIQTKRVKTIQTNFTGSITSRRRHKSRLHVSYFEKMVVKRIACRN